MFWKQRFLEDIHDAYESGYKDGFYKGYKEGFDKGRRKRIIELYRKEIISIEIAMSELNMTKEEIEKEMSELLIAMHHSQQSCSLIRHLL